MEDDGEMKERQEPQKTMDWGDLKEEQIQYLNKNIPHIQRKGTLIKSAWWDFLVAMDQAMLCFPLIIQMEVFIVVIMPLLF